MLEKHNQVVGQRAQEEVRGQGSEVVHFIDRVLPASCQASLTPTPTSLQSQSPILATVPIPIHQMRKRMRRPNIQHPKGLGRAEWQGWVWGRGLQGWGRSRG